MFMDMGYMLQTEVGINRQRMTAISPFYHFVSILKALL